MKNRDIKLDGFKRNEFPGFITTDSSAYKTNF